MPPRIPLREPIASHRIGLLLESLGEDAVGELYAMYVERALQDLEALEAHHAQRDLVPAASRIHDLKGASANLGVTKVHHWAIAIDAMLKLGAMEEAAPLLPRLREAVDEAIAHIVELLGEEIHPDE